MATSAGRLAGGKGKPMFGTKSGENKNFGERTSVAVMGSAGCGGLKQEYKILRLSPGATEKDVKNAYRPLALQYYPDVCKGQKCGVNFYKIKEAYRTMMSSLFKINKQEEYYDNNYSGMDEWEEWMGWEGPCPSRDYSNHIISVFITIYNGSLQYLLL